MIGSEAIVKALEKEDVEYIFGYPGATIAPVYDVLVKSKIKHVLVRHEQHAGHAASGYARISGKPGVCMVTSGPGALNLVTALGTAYMDSIPLVAITGQVTSDLLGRDVFQEADMTGATESFTKYSYLVKDAKELPTVIKEAFHIASTGRPGPVLIDIPMNLQQQKADFKFPKDVDIRSYKPTIKGHVGQIKRVIKAIERSESPVICAGGGVFASKAVQSFRKFIEVTNIPVVTTMMGIGALPTDHELYMGMVGMHGKSLANQTLSNADLLILMGARVSDRAMLLPSNVTKETKIIHIDIDPAEIGKNLGTFIPVVGDLNAVIKQLLEHDFEKTDYLSTKILAAEKTEAEYKVKKNYVNPKNFVRKLTKALPKNFVYCADVGQNQLWSAGNAVVTGDSRFLTTGGMGTMGYAIGAALGAKLANPKRFSIAVCGDGSFQMSMMELATICQQKADVKIVVMSNEKLGLVREIQKNQFNENYSAVDLNGSPDPVKIAEAYSIDADVIKSDKEVDVAIKKLINHKGSYLLQCKVDPKESSL